MKIVQYQDHWCPKGSEKAWQRYASRARDMQIALERNPKQEGFENYGGRGITYDPRWEKFENFLADMGERPAGKTLDRYPDKNGNYEKDNCRWATSQEQACNKRAYKTYARKTYAGKSVPEWAAQWGIKEPSARARLIRNGVGPDG